jgi:hypothetical protein
MSSNRTENSGKLSSFVDNTARDDSASRIRWEPERLAQRRTFFLYTQSSRLRLRLREPPALPGTWVFLPRCRRDSGGKRAASELVEVRGNPRKYPQYTGAIKRHELRVICPPPRKGTFQGLSLDFAEFAFCV